jgi:hypothetical protein
VEDLQHPSQTACTAQQGDRIGGRLRRELSYAAVEPNGDVVVGFINQQHAAAWEVPKEYEDRVMTVTSHGGGVTWSNPVHVADTEDGAAEGITFNDYPANLDARATQTGFQFRTGYDRRRLTPTAGSSRVRPCACVRTKRIAAGRGSGALIGFLRAASRDMRVAISGCRDVRPGPALSAVGGPADRP